jgi:predicted MPP superfamily phosphohydrolase
VIYISVVILIFLFYISLILPTQWLKIEQIKHPLNLNLKILQISDLHVERLRISPSKITTIIHRENPNFKFELIGIDDFDSGMSNIEASFHAVDHSRTKVVITHDPNVVLHLINTMTF